MVSFSMFQDNRKDIKTTTNDVILLSLLLTRDIFSEIFRILMQYFDKKNFEQVVNY